MNSATGISDVAIRPDMEESIKKLMIEKRTIEKRMIEKGMIEPQPCWTGD
jgi:hypothetical protein